MLLIFRDFGRPVMERRWRRAIRRQLFGDKWVSITLLTPSGTDTDVTTSTGICHVHKSNWRGALAADYENVQLVL